MRGNMTRQSDSTVNKLRFSIIVRPFVALILLSSCSIVGERASQLPTLAPKILDTQINKLIDTLGEPNETTLVDDKRRFKWVEKYLAVDCHLEVHANYQGIITKTIWSGPFEGCKDWSDKLVSAYDFNRQ